MKGRQRGPKKQKTWETRICLLIPGRWVSHRQSSPAHPCVQALASVRHFSWLWTSELCTLICTLQINGFWGSCFITAQNPGRPLSRDLRPGSRGGAKFSPIGQGSPTVGTWKVALERRIPKLRSRSLERDKTDPRINLPSPCGNGFTYSEMNYVAFLVE